MRRHPRDLRRHRVVFADRRAPLHALAGPLFRDVRHPAPDRRAAGRNCQAASVQRDQRELESETFAPQQIFFGDEDVFEVDQYVADAAQTHELAAMLDGEAGRIRFDDERRDLFFLFAVDDLRRRPRHDHDDLGLGGVGAPQLLTVDDPTLAVR